MEKLHILKIGGKLLSKPYLLDAVLSAFIKKEGVKILVHGGGNKASELLQQLDIQPRMTAGRRITDAPTLEVVTMVYAGLINKQLVSQLQALGCNAIGLSGADGNAIQAHKRPPFPFDYGFAGDIDIVNSKMIISLLNSELCPVFCAITHDKEGQLLNTNADTIASTLAVAMAPFFEVELIFCLEKNGVLADPENDATVIPELSEANFQKLKAEGIIYDGMIPKLDNAFSALHKGVSKVCICGPDSLIEAGGTWLQN
ncbi:MAG: acetylglutamate kinase [Bacteroidota bacterium]